MKTSRTISPAIVCILMANGPRPVAVKRCRLTNRRSAARMAMLPVAVLSMLNGQSRLHGMPLTPGPTTHSAR